MFFATIVAIAFFATTLIEEKINDNNKLIVVTHFRFKQKEKKKGDNNKFTIIALFAITTREEKKCDNNKKEKKKGTMARLWYHLLCFKQ